MNEPIDVKDLCVGSYVQHHNGAIIQIRGMARGVSGSFLSNPNESVYLNWGNLRPIPITPEWLAELGFFPLENPKGWKNGIMYGDLGGFMNCGVYIHNTGLINLYTSLPKCLQNRLESIHQLQQIVWAMDKVWLTLGEKEVSHEL